MKKKRRKRKKSQFFFFSNARIAVLLCRKTKGGKKDWKHEQRINGRDSHIGDEHDPKYLWSRTGWRKERKGKERKGKER